MVKIKFAQGEIDDIIDKYINQDLSCNDIAKIYDVSRPVIGRLLKKEGLLKRGLSNGQKIDLTTAQKIEIKILYQFEYKSHSEIAKELGLSEPFINKYLHNCGYRRNMSEGVSVGMVKRYGHKTYQEYLETVPEFQKYTSKVLSITNKQALNTLPNYNKRGRDGYHLDHKFSIAEGFKQKVDPEIIGSIKNLEFIPWLDNMKKKNKCSIDLQDLI